MINNGNEWCSGVASCLNCFFFFFCFFLSTFPSLKIYKKTLSFLRSLQINQRFLLRSEMHLPPEIRYLSRYGWNNSRYLIWYEMRVYLYRWRCCYGKFLPYQPVWYETDFLEASSAFFSFSKVQGLHIHEFGLLFTHFKWVLAHGLGLSYLWGPISFEFQYL